MGGTLSRRAKALRFSLLQHSGQVAEWSQARAWRAGGVTTKLETAFTLFYLVRTILPPIVTCSFHLFPLQWTQETHLLGGPDDFPDRG